MKKYMATLALVLLAACQSAPRLEDDTRYAKLATVVNKHEFSELERKQAQANSRSSSISVGVGFGIGVGSGGMMLGMGSPLNSQRDKSDEQPQIARGATRYTVKPLGSEELIEVMSYIQYKVGDCVKVLAGHPSEYTRLFELKPDERCK